MLGRFQELKAYYVEDNLMISFDALKSVDPNLQDIFLDIACFYIGWNNEKVVKILETCYTCVNRNVDILRKRCLITINDEDELGMPDLLRDMGRWIASNKSPSEPEKHSRLWDLNDIYSMLNNDKGTEAIQGIIPPKSLYHFTNLEDAHKGESFAAKKFRRMTKLRFLYLDKVNLTESFEDTFEDLRWLCWNSCPLKCLPSEFFPKKLVILELPHSEMRTMWESNMVSQVFDKLRTINMSWSLNINTTPDSTNFPCLETLNLNCCISLEEVHISIGSLARLVCLDLGDCSNLKSLPDSICSLRALETLNISRCSILKALPIDLGNIESLKVLNAVELTASSLPDSIGRLSNLVKLRLSYSKNLKAPPDSICNLRSLEILCINSCNKLEEMPHQLGRITSLRKLDASVNKWLKMLPDISQLSNIGHLNLTDCFHLLSIAALPPNLKCLTAKGCTSLERLPNLSNLKRLEVLDIEDCWCLKEILGLEELIAIEELMLKGCNSSLLAYTLTKRFFEVLSGFAHEIRIHISPTGFPDWISHSSNLVSTMSFNLTSNVSHKFLAMIFCIRQCEGVGEIEYSVKYTPS